MELTYDFKPVFAPPVVGVEISQRDLLSERVRQISSMIADTSDRMIREQLIALGWTPPEVVAVRAESLSTLSQALLEVHHAVTRPHWYSNGESAALNHYHLWHRKATEALDKLKEAACHENCTTGADLSGSANTTEKGSL